MKALGKVNKLYAAAYPVVFPIFCLVHPCHTIGRENIPEGAAVICVNHTHASDPFVAVFAFGRRNQVFPMAKIELRRVPFIGWVLEKAGVIYVDRGNADVSAIKKCLQYLKIGRKVLIFPEGTREKEGRELEAKSGAAMLAMRTGTPILPVYIPNERPWFRRLNVAVGEPFLPEFEGKRPCSADYQRAARETMQRIDALKEEFYAKD